MVVEILGEEHSPVIQAFYFMRCVASAGVVLLHCATTDPRFAMFASRRRMLRLMRTLRNLGQFRVMITSFVDIIPALMR